MKQQQPSFHHQIMSAATVLPDDLAEMLPSGWSSDVPLVRISTCGKVTIEVLREVQQSADGRATFVYGPPKMPHRDL